MQTSFFSNGARSAIGAKRAVVFLDPYGMQVEWGTIEALAATKAIDLWYLFPLGGSARMLTHSGNIDEAWKKRLDMFFGTADWRTRLYQTHVRDGLFGAFEEVVHDATVRTWQKSTAGSETKRSSTIPTSTFDIVRRYVQIHATSTTRQRMLQHVAGLQIHRRRCATNQFCDPVSMIEFSYSSDRRF
jgi:three-Cys-motif partner protein